MIVPPSLLLGTILLTALAAEEDRPLGVLTHVPPAVAPIPDSVPTVRAAAAEGEIRVDGRLDEAAWSLAVTAGDFIQGEPVEGVPAEVATEVRVLYDDDAIYVGARMYDPDPERIARQLTRRGEEGDAVDWFELSLDTNNDRRTAYAFRVTAAGVQADRFRYDDASSDGAWEAVWESAVHQDEEGWTAEVRIPLSQLRFDPSTNPQSWGVNFARFRVATNELSYFALESRERFGGVSVFGRLTELGLAGSTRHAEIRPYVLGLTHRRPDAERSPFLDRAEQRARMGADVRYRLGSTFVLDLTVNPDFGQVEADPAVINLTAFETFFPERRPFFTRDDRLFDFNVTGARNNLFYSRRVGRSPQGRAPPGAEAPALPGETTIRSAAKVTGRTAGGLELGALVALTDREHGRALDVDTGEPFRFAVEPPARYGVFRVHQEARDGDSRLGMMVTATRRDMEPDGLLAELIPARAYTGGVDLEHTWDDRSWELTAVVAGSRVSGSRAAIQRLQTSSTHYFQRPDADHLEVDSTATRLTGGEWRLELSKRTGRHWTWSAWTGQRLPGFEINDLGFGPEGERMHAGGRLTYQELTPGNTLRSYRFTLFGYNRWRHEALDDPLSRARWGEAREQAQLNGGADLTFLNYWSVELDVRYKPEFLSGVLTRGGPRMVDPGNLQYEVSLASDRRARFAARPWVLYGHGFHGGTEAGAGVEVAFRPAAWARVSLDSEYRRRLAVTQYVATAPDPEFDATFGNRYLFSDLQRSELAFEGRLDMAFSPSTSLQLYTQPLLSAGAVQGYKQLERPDTFDFAYLGEGEAREAEDGIRCVDGSTCRAGGRRHVDFTGDGVSDFSFADRDFTIRSLRASTVFRWEYRLGSTLYLVWQHRRSLEDGTGTLSPASDLADLLRSPMENVFIVKVNYWLGM